MKEYTVEEILDHADELAAGRMRDSTLSPKFIEVVEHLIEIEGGWGETRVVVRIGATLCYVFKDLGIDVWTEERV